MKKSIIICICAIVIILIISIIAVFRTLNKTIEKEFSTENVVTVNDTVGTKYTDTYKESNLKIVLDKKQNGSVRSVSFKDGNKEITSTISSQINSAIDKYLEDKYFVVLNKCANFSNILSLHIVVLDIDNYYKEVDNLYLNCRIDTGESLKFSDVFINKNIAYNAFQGALTNTANNVKKNYKYAKNEELTSFIDQNLNDFNNDKQYLFAIFPNRIEIYNLSVDTTLSIGDILPTRLEIRLTDYMDQVDIFKKYLTNEKNNSSEIPVFMQLDRYGVCEQVNDKTYLIQYFKGNDIDLSKLYMADDFSFDVFKNEEIDSTNIERIRKYADKVAESKAKEDNYKIIVQNICLEKDTNKIKIAQETNKVSEQYFNSNTMKNDFANSEIFEGNFEITFTTKNVETIKENFEG